MGAVIRSAVITVFLHGALVGAVPYALLHVRLDPLHADIGPFKWLGLAPLAFGAAMYAASARLFPSRGNCSYSLWETSASCFRTGPYAVTRNPMYTSLMALVVGQAVLLEAGILLLYAAALFGFFHSLVAGWEEPRLRARFGSEYEEYLRRVPRWPALKTR